MVERRKGNNNRLAELGVILASGAEDLSTFTPRKDDVGAIVIEILTTGGARVFTVTPGDPNPVLIATPSAVPNSVQVDPVAGNDIAGGIGNGVPFKTFQAAVDAIVDANATSGPRAGYTIFPTPWAQFDEDVTIDVSNALHLAIIAQGGWMLGNFSEASWRPPTGVGRNLVCVGNASAVEGIRPSISIQSTSWVSWLPTSHEAYAGARISGRIDLSAISAGNLEFAFAGEVFGEGSVDAFNSGLVIVSAYFRNSRFKKTVSGSNLNLFKAWDCRFEGLITCTGYSGIFNCELEDGLTTSGLAGVPPQGFFSCDLQGDFTGPASAWLLLDPASNFTFKSNGAALIGGGSKVIVGDLTP